MITLSVDNAAKRKKSVKYSAQVLNFPISPKCLSALSA